jgi:hypothetical protein
MKGLPSEAVMHDQKNASLLDRLLMPAMRLMARLRFLQKALVIGAAFVVTCAVLTGFIVVSTQRGIADAELAGSAVEPLEAMHGAMLAMQQHRGLATRQSFKVPLAPGALETARATVDTGLARVEAWEKDALDDAPLAKQMAAVRASWQKAQGRRVCW